MALDTKVNGLTWAEAAKGIAPYLNITVPKSPKEWKKIQQGMNRADLLSSMIGGLHTAYLFCTSRTKYKEKKQSIKSEKERHEEILKWKEEENLKTFIEAGLETQQQKDAWQVAQFAGYRLSHFALYEKSTPFISESKFEKVLDTSIESGIASLNSKYWVNIKGVEMPEIVNPDFKDKAKVWLLKEIYTRTDNEKDLKLLERVNVFRNEKGDFHLS